MRSGSGERAGDGGTGCRRFVNRRRSAGDKGHRREVELTIEAIRRGENAPIPFADLIEVTEASFAVEEAVRTQRMVSVNIPGSEVTLRDRVSH